MVSSTKLRITINELVFKNDSNYDESYSGVGFFVRDNIGHVQIYDRLL